MLEPFIDGKTVYLRGLKESDIEHIGRWLESPKVTLHLEMGRKPFTTRDFDRIRKSISDNSDEIVFSIFDRSTDDCIGFCGLYSIDWISRRGQLNILIGEESVWDRGFGSESCGLLLKYAFKKINLNSVQLGVNANNQRAIKAYEKVGFVKEGNRREFLYCNGEYCDMMVFSVLRSEYSTDD